MADGLAPQDGAERGEARLEQAACAAALRLLGLAGGPLSAALQPVPPPQEPQEQQEQQQQQQQQQQQRRRDARQQQPPPKPPPQSPQQRAQEQQQQVRYAVPSALTGVPRATMVMHDPDDLWRLLEPGFAARVPDVRFKWGHRSLHSLQLDVVAPSSPACQVHVSSPLDACRIPFVYLYVVRCDSLEAYKAVVKPRVRAWVDEMQAGGNGLDAPHEWMIVYVPLLLQGEDEPVGGGAGGSSVASAGSGLSGSSKAAAAAAAATAAAGAHALKSALVMAKPQWKQVFERLRADFAEVSAGAAVASRVVRVTVFKDAPALARAPAPASLPGAPPSAAAAAAAASPAMHSSGDGEWGELLSRLCKCVVGAFETRSRKFEELVQKLEEQVDMPGWNYCSYLVVKENLALTWLQVGQSFDAIRILDALSLQFDNLFADGVEPRRPAAGGGSVATELARARAARARSEREQRVPTPPQSPSNGLLTPSKKIAGRVTRKLSASLAFGSASGGEAASASAARSPPASRRSSEVAAAAASATATTAMSATPAGAPPGSPASIATLQSPLASPPPTPPAPPANAVLSVPRVLLDLKRKPFREQIYKSALSTLEIRLYLFVRSTLLLFTLGRQDEALRRGLHFVSSLSEEMLREHRSTPAHELDDEAFRTAMIAHSWAAAACLELICATHAANAAMTLPPAEGDASVVEVLLYQSELLGLAAARFVSIVELVHFKHQHQHQHESRGGPGSGAKLHSAETDALAAAALTRQRWLQSLPAFLLRPQAEAAPDVEERLEGLGLRAWLPGGIAEALGSQAESVGLLLMLLRVRAEYLRSAGRPRNALRVELRHAALCITNSRWQEARAVIEQLDSTASALTRPMPPVHAELRLLHALAQSRLGRHSEAVLHSLAVLCIVGARADQRSQALALLTNSVRRSTRTRLAGRPMPVLRAQVVGFASPSWSGGSGSGAASASGNIPYSVHRQGEILTLQLRLVSAFPDKITLDRVRVRLRPSGSATAAVNDPPTATSASAASGAAAPGAAARGGGSGGGGSSSISSSSSSNNNNNSSTNKRGAQVDGALVVFRVNEDEAPSWSELSSTRFSTDPFDGEPDGCGLSVMSDDDDDDDDGDGDDDDEDEEEDSDAQGPGAASGGDDTIDGECEGGSDARAVVLEIGSTALAPGAQVVTLVARAPLRAEGELHVDQLSFTFSEHLEVIYPVESCETQDATGLAARLRVVAMPALFSAEVVSPADGFVDASADKPVRVQVQVRMRPAEAQLRQQYPVAKLTARLDAEEEQLAAYGFALVQPGARCETALAEGGLALALALERVQPVQLDVDELLVSRQGETQALRHKGRLQQTLSQASVPVRVELDCVLGGGAVVRQELFARLRFAAPFEVAQRVLLVGGYIWVQLTLRSNLPYATRVEAPTLDGAAPYGAPVPAPAPAPALTAHEVGPGQSLALAFRVAPVPAPAPAGSDRVLRFACLYAQPGGGTGTVLRDVAWREIAPTRTVKVDVICANPDTVRVGSTATLVFRLSWDASRASAVEACFASPHRRGTINVTASPTLTRSKSFDQADTAQQHPLVALPPGDDSAVAYAVCFNPSQWMVVGTERGHARMHGGHAAEVVCEFIPLLSGALLMPVLDLLSAPHASAQDLTNYLVVKE